MRMRAGVFRNDESGAGREQIVDRCVHELLVMHPWLWRDSPGRPLRINPRPVISADYLQIDVSKLRVAPCRFDLRPGGGGGGGGKYPPRPAMHEPEREALCNHRSASIFLRLY